jgi:hypothetical protein
MSIIIRRFGKDGHRLKKPHKTELWKFLRTNQIANTPRIKKPEEGKTFMACTVPVDKAQELCPDPRIFNCCAQALSICHSTQEARETLESWNKFCEDNKCPYLKERPIKETEDSYYYKFPKDRFYIIRWLDSGGVHLYPKVNGELPEGFKSKEDVENYVKFWYIPNTAKVVSGLEASKYPVPKRW